MIVVSKKRAMSKIPNMSRDWKKYNKELIRRGEILIDPEILAVSQEKKKKQGRPEA